ncbi:flagella synthesis protein FlgN [Nitrosomonas sp. ANs5]|uniref:flagella synthesis protein FlgN n=1 Tax=Nitrosomonas sp. ANs5 TaxID=3423941 RepID=UPI003D34D541
MHKILNSGTLYEVLQLELGAMKTFLALLEREQKTLADGDINELSLLTGDKDRVADQLSQLEARRNQLLTAGGLPDGAQGIKMWLSGNHAESAIECAWKQLLDLARCAKALNLTNAVIVSNHLSHTQRTLSALQSAAGRVTLYSAKGATTF